MFRETQGTKSSPRNVLIRRVDGTEVIRPFRGLRKLAAVVLLALWCVAAEAQNIGTKSLSPGVATRIFLSTSLTTTLLLPGTPSGVFGLGLVGGQSNSGGSVQIDHPEGSNVLVLRALTENARVIATVLLDGKLFVLALESSATPDVAVTLVLKGSQEDPQAAPKAQPVTPEEVVEARPKYDPELFIGLLRRRLVVRLPRWAIAQGAWNRV
jgi:hypothetical protein